MCIRDSACILRCGKEAWRSANAIVTALRQGLNKAGLPETEMCIRDSLLYHLCQSG